MLCCIRLLLIFFLVFNGITPIREYFKFSIVCVRVFGTSTRVL